MTTQTPHPKRVFPSHEVEVIRGIQSGMAYYVGMVSLRELKKCFTFATLDDTPIEKRSQRELRKSRVNKIKDYILKAFKRNKRNRVVADRDQFYAFGSAVIAIDPPWDGDDMEFVPLLSEPPDIGNIGKLIIPRDALARILDGQHRIFGLIAALEEQPDLDCETLPVIFFLDLGQRWRGQMCIDLNCNSVKFPSSLVLLLSQRDPLANLVKSVIKRVELLNLYIDWGRASLTQDSEKMFTFLAIYEATKALLANHQELGTEEQLEIASRFWTAVVSNMSNWQAVASGEFSPSWIRETKISSHPLAIAALGRMGAELLSQPDWEPRLEALQHLNWSTTNPDWDGTGLVDGSHDSESWLADYLLKRVKAFTEPETVQEPPLIVAAARARIASGLTLANVATARARIASRLTLANFLNWLRLLPAEMIIEYGDRHPLENFLLYRLYPVKTEIEQSLENPPGCGLNLHKICPSSHELEISNISIEFVSDDDEFELLGTKHSTHSDTYLPLDSQGAWLPALLEWKSGTDWEFTIGEMIQFLEPFETDHGIIKRVD